MKPLLATLVCLLYAISAGAAQLTIAAAASMKFALDEILVDFGRSVPDDRIDVVYGASGKLNAQIQQGAPYDLYLAADLAYPQALLDAGLALPGTRVRPYARGRLVLWSAQPPVPQLTELGATRITRIAIANPRHAPYGQRAVEAFQQAGVWEQIVTKLVYAENISQAAQFVQSGNAQVGLLAYSLVLSPAMVGKGHYELIPESLHAPLEQGYVRTLRSAGNPLAERFARYLEGPQASAVLRRHGFVVPDRTLQTGTEDAL